MLSCLYKTKKEFSPYLCLFASYLLDSFNYDKSQTVRAVVLLCKNVDWVSIEARKVSLRVLLTVLIEDTERKVVTSMRARRRKIMKYAFYLRVDLGFCSFLSRVGLKSLRRKRREEDCMLVDRLNSKMKKFTERLK